MKNMRALFIVVAFLLLSSYAFGKVIPIDQLKPQGQKNEFGDYPVYPVPAYEGVKKAIATDEVSITSANINFETDIENNNITKAYLYIALKNMGKNEISELSLFISYYTKDNYLIEKVKVENVLTEPMTSEEEKKYKIYLGSHNPEGIFGDVYDTHYYPFDQRDSLDHFNVKITDVKTNFWKRVIK